MGGDAPGRRRFADFGIAKHRDDTALTSTGMVVGSIEYMAPERFGADPNANGPAGDQFSLGATRFETFEPHPPLRHAGALTALTERLLAKNPEERPRVGEAIGILRGLSVELTAVVEPRRESGGSGAAADRDDEYDVILESAGNKKIQVIKVIRELTPLGLKEAKDLADTAPRPVQRGKSARG